MPADAWLAARNLRNRMVHEYERDPAALADALQAAHEAVPMLVDFMKACQAYCRERGLG